MSALVDNLADSVPSSVDENAVINTAMILAAGEGRRMRPLTLERPKPLIKVGKLSLLERQLKALIGVGVQNFVINAAYLAEQIEDALKHFDWQGARYQVSVEEVPLETGGGLRKALPLLGDGPFILSNSDVWTDFDYANLLKRRLQKATLAHLVLVENPVHNPNGDFILNNEGLVERQAKEGQLGQAWTFSGISVIRPQLISGFSELRSIFPLREAILEAIDSGRVTGQCHMGRWSDVGTPDRLKEVRAYYD